MVHFAKRFFNQGGIVLDGLSLYYDASNTASYPGSGTTVYNLAGTNNGTMSNVTISSGMFSFNGTSSNITIATPVTNSKTLMCWANFNNVTTTAYFFGGSQTGVRYNGTNLLVVPGAGTFTMLNWTKVNSVVHFAAVDKLNGYYDIYINGSYIGQTGGTVYSALTINQIGSRIDVPSYFNGPLNQLMIYNRPLSAAEVLQNYNEQKSKYGL